MNSRKIVDKTIDKVISNIVDKKDLVGILLFGSYVREGGDRISDIDIAIIYNALPKTYPLNIKKTINNIQLDIWLYPIKYFKDTFESEKYRNKSDTWFKTSLWIELMRNSLIIEDKNNILEKYRDIAIKWKWRRSEIEPLMDKACLNIDVAERENDVFKRILALRDATYILSLIHI